MSVKLKLRRTGSRHQPQYRIIVADARSPRDGRFIENLGHYNPLTDPETVVVNADRTRFWIQNGAQPTEAVSRILKTHGVVEKA